MITPSSKFGVSCSWTRPFPCGPHPASSTRSLSATLTFHTLRRKQQPLLHHHHTPHQGQLHLIMPSTHHLALLTLHHLHPMFSKRPLNHQLALMKAFGPALLGDAKARVFHSVPVHAHDAGSTARAHTQQTQMHNNHALQDICSFHVVSKQLVIALNKAFFAHMGTHSCCEKML